MTNQVKGTKVLFGKEAKQYTDTISKFRTFMGSKNIDEIIIPSVWGSKTFVEKAKCSDILEQMFSWTTQGKQDVCLTPEMTGCIQELANDGYFKTSSNPIYTKKMFYVSRCYRYEKPQAGRQREFTQLGLEIISTDPNRQQYIDESKSLLIEFLDSIGVEYSFNDSAKRGLTYYVEDGFEVECSKLGAQKQIAGGGNYKEGVGFGIGLERLLLAL
jgi:histidyl-tRNA synthetase